MLKLSKEKAIADQQREVVDQERQEAGKQAEKAEEIQRQCQEILSVALPDLEAATKALKTLKRDDIIEIRTMQKPPENVKMTMEAVAIFCGEQPAKIPDQNDRSIMKYDY